MLARDRLLFCIGAVEEEISRSRMGQLDQARRCFWELLAPAVYEDYAVSKELEDDRELADRVNALEMVLGVEL